MADERDDERVDVRAASLLPEEEAAGDVDATTMAEAVLTDSDQRQADRDAAPADDIEQRTSEEVTDEPE